MLFLHQTAKLTDFCVGVMCAPIMTYLSWEINQGNINNYMDSYAWALQLLFTTATVANTFLLAIDRYVAIVHPLRDQPHVTSTFF